MLDVNISNLQRGRTTVDLFTRYRQGGTIKLDLVS